MNRIHTLALTIFVFSIYFPGCVTQEKGEMMDKDIIALKTQVENLQQTLKKTDEENRINNEELRANIKKIKTTTQLTTASDHVELDRIMRDMTVLNGLIEKNGYDIHQQELKAQEKFKSLETRILVIEVKLGIPPPEKEGEESKQAIVTPIEAYPDDPDELYNRAKELILKEKNTVESRKLMAVFLHKFPDHPKTDNAQYWVGESYYQEKNYHQAVMEFQKVTDKYKKGDAVDDALYMLGESFRQLNMIDDAKVFYEECVDRFPKTLSAKKAKSALRNLK